LSIAISGSQIHKPDHSVLNFLFSPNALHQVPLLFCTPNLQFFSCTASILQQVKRKEKKRNKKKRKRSVPNSGKSIAKKRTGV